MAVRSFVKLSGNTFCAGNIHVVGRIPNRTIIDLQNRAWGFPSQIELFSRRADFELDSRIIPFKMYAWLNNLNLKKRGEKVNSDDIQKHKNDVFRLLPLINPDVKIQTGGNVRGTVLSFIEKMGPEAVADEFLSNGRTKEETLDILKNVYL